MVNNSIIKTEKVMVIFMKKDIIGRYECTESGEIIVDISTQKVEDLYDDFDRRSHFLKKDLNQDLVEYIIDSVTEIDKREFIVQFNLEVAAEKESITRVKNSVKNFFVYMQELERRKMKEMGRTSIILFFIGFIIASISVLMNQSEIVKTSVIAGVVAEGLTVAAWVSLWEALATILIKWMPHKKKISIYQRIADTKVVFNFPDTKTSVKV